MRTRIIFAVLMMVAGESSPPWFGTWKLTTNPGRYKRVTSKIEPWEDGLKVTYEMVGTRGGVTHLEWRGKFDGRDYPIQGADYVLTNAYTPVNDHSYQIVVKVDGVVAATTRVEISPDGKTLTTVTSEQNVTTTAVYRK